MTDPIWQPCAALVGLTALVWVKLYADRLSEMRMRGIDPQALARARDAAGRLEKSAAADNFREILALYERGAFKPTIGREYALTDYAAALRCLMNREAIGKVVVNVR